MTVPPGGPAGDLPAGPAGVPPAGAPVVVVHPDAGVLAAAAAARLVTRLVDARTARGEAHVVLTGGGVGTGTLAALAASPARDAIDWAALHVWWGDERFLPEGHPDRNATQARQALLDRVPVDPARVHEMPASGGVHGDDPDAAAGAYADELARFATGGAGVPAFDVLMLGVGPDGHVASLFPGHPALQERGRTVVGVRGSPKPPPTRVSLTLPAIAAAREVWLLAAGAEKAHAVGVALGQASGRAARPEGGQDPGPELPAAGARGRDLTLWLLDTASAAALPS